MHVILFFFLLNFFNLIDGMAFAVDLPEIFSKDMESVHKYYNESLLFSKE